MSIFVFDLDDTLYKERDFVVSGFRAVAESLANKYGLSKKEMFHVMTTAPFNPFDSLEEYVTNRAIQQSLKIEGNISQWVDIYRNHIPSIDLAPETETTLNQLIKNGSKLALITDGRSVTQRNKIKALGLEKWIEPSLILISEEVGGEKYTPVAFEKIMDLNPQENSFIYVGDNPMKDFVWANRLGWQTIQLNDNGRNVHSQKIALPSKDYQPKIKIDEISEILNIDIK